MKYFVKISKVGDIFIPTHITDRFIVNYIKGTKKRKIYRIKILKYPFCLGYKLRCPQEDNDYFPNDYYDIFLGHKNKVRVKNTPADWREFSGNHLDIIKDLLLYDDEIIEVISIKHFVYRPRRKPRTLGQALED